MDSNFGVCRGCGYRIKWIKTRTGKAMPVNTQAVRFSPGGGPETFVLEDGKVERGNRRQDGEKIGFISHFATCPQAGRFRGRVQEDDYGHHKNSGLIEEEES